MSMDENRFIDEHVFTHSDDYRFVGYESNVEDLVDATVRMSEEFNGKPLEDVVEEIRGRENVLDAKKQAMLNVLGSYNEVDYHVDKHVVQSYFSELIDEYAVNNVIKDRATYMEDKGFNTYLEDGDPRLNYTIISVSETEYMGKLQEEFEVADSYDTFDMDETLDHINGYYPSAYRYMSYPSDEFGYTMEPGEGSTQIRKAFYRGQEIDSIEGEWVSGVVDYDVYDGEEIIGDVFDTGEHTYDDYSFTTDDGTYRIEDGDVYKYNSDETKVQKITGTDSVSEAKELTTRVNEIEIHRSNEHMYIHTAMVHEIQRDHDFPAVMYQPKPLDYEYDAPKMESINPELEQEHDLEP